VSTFEIKIDELMRDIREEVRQKRGQKMAVNVVTQGIEPYSALDDGVIEEALATADKVHAVGENLPPMTRQTGFRRILATSVGRIFLRLAQIITRDQRQFNYSLLVVLRGMRHRIRGLHNRTAALEKAGRWVQALEQRLVEVQGSASSRMEALEQKLVGVERSASSRVEALEQKLVEVQGSAASRVEKLERMIIQIQSTAYAFDDVTKPGHILVADNQGRRTLGTKISYAQNREDVLLARLFSDRKTGFYIDIGAHDPVNYSITKYFYDLGWHGINVEPSLDIFPRLCAARARDIDLNFGLSNRDGILTFYEATKGAGLSTFVKSEMERHCEAGFEFVERQCQVTTLAKVCEQYVQGEIDFLSIDVEGHEREVIEGGNWKRWRPSVLVIEATKPGTTIPSHDCWEPLLLKADYIFAMFDGLNRYYVRAEDKHLLASLRIPVNVFDSYIPYEHLRQIEELTSHIKLPQ
jgi:FkbM family methyltransferase